MSSLDLIRSGETTLTIAESPALANNSLRWHSILRRLAEQLTTQRARPNYHFVPTLYDYLVENITKRVITPTSNSHSIEGVCCILFVMHL